MAGSSSTTDDASLEETPIWAVAVVCAILITVSFFIEHVLHLLTKFLRRRNRKSLNQALNKIKAELMLLGFVSLLLTVSEQPVARICIPKSMGNNFLPCKDEELPSDISEEATCEEEDKISLLSRNGVNQLHFLIFVVVLVHVLSCVITLGLGMAKMKRWQSWEEETRTLEYEFTNDPRRFRFTRQTSFGRRHLKCWSKRPLLLWPASFLRLFTGSISRADYFVLRHGFITAHISSGGKFDFQKFLSRALDKDFEVVVGVSLWIWIFSVLFIVFSAHGFYSYLWMPFIPLLMVVVVGTKLQFIITKMCLESHGESNVVRGTILVKPDDNLFWLGRPQLLLYLIHFILFQNSFEVAFFVWTWYQFGLRSCFHEETKDIAIRISMGFLVQLLVGYLLLPLYVLVTQMGSSMKNVVFTERVSKGLKNWHALAKQRLTPNRSISSDPSPSISPSRTRDTSVSNAHESEIEELETPPNESYAMKESTERKAKEPESDHKPPFNGEISFGW